MDSTATTVPSRAGDARGGAALNELGELLLLRQRPLLAGVAVVVGVGLVLTLVAPGILPPNAVTGALVGLLGCVAGVAAAVVVDGADPVLRGPRHLRRDGIAVLGRVSVGEVGTGAGDLLGPLTRRVEQHERARLMITGLGVDPARLARGLASSTAGAGLTSLVVDLTDVVTRPGLAEVGAGEVRLGEAATLAGDRPMAIIGAGKDRRAAITATVALIERPPSDLRLLLVVEPGTGAASVAQACDRTVLVVAADRTHRAEVKAAVELHRREGGVVECVVVGGGPPALSLIPDMLRPAAPTRPAEEPTADADPSSVADASSAGSPSGSVRTIAPGTSHGPAVAGGTAAAAASAGAAAASAAIAAAAEAGLAASPAVADGPVASQDTAEPDEPVMAAEPDEPVVADEVEAVEVVDEAEQVEEPTLTAFAPPVDAPEPFDAAEPVDEPEPVDTPEPAATPVAEDAPAAPAVRLEDPVTVLHDLAPAPPLAVEAETVHAQDAPPDEVRGGESRHDEDLRAAAALHALVQRSAQGHR